MPASWQILKATALVCFISVAATAISMLNLNTSHALLIAAGKVTVYLALIYLLLKSAGKSERWVQTMIALLGALTLTNLISLPFLPELQAIGEGKHAIVPGKGVFLVGTLEIWFLAIMVRVLRDSLEIRVGQAILLTISIIIIETLTLSALSNALGLSSESIVIAIEDPTR